MIRFTGIARVMALLLPVTAFMPAPAAAEALGQRARSLVFMEVIAARGLDCGLLRPWQAAALRTQMIEEAARLSPAQRDAAMAAAKADAAQTACDAPKLTGWIDAVADNMETEMLPPHLLIYRALAARQPPPAFFVEGTAGVDVADMLLAIEARIAEYAASGRTFEGGKRWPAYAERTGAQIEAVLSRIDDPSFEGAARLRSMMEQAIEIVHLWRRDAGAGR